MLLQRITKPLAWAQLVISVVIISTVIYGHLKFHDTWAENGPFLESTRASLQHAKQSLAQANDTLPGISSGLPTIGFALRNANVALTKTADVMENLSSSMRFSAPTSIEMQGIRPIIVMTRPLETNANDVKAQASVIRDIGSSLQNSANAFQMMPSVLTEVGETMVATQDAITQLEPMLGQIEVLMNWGSLIALLIATWGFMNSLTTLALAHRESIAADAD